MGGRGSIHLQDLNAFMVKRREDGKGKGEGETLQARGQPSKRLLHPTARCNDALFRSELGPRLSEGGIEFPRSHDMEWHKKSLIFNVLAHHPRNDNAGCSEKVRQLLESTPEAASARDKDGWTPLMQASYCGQCEPVDILAECGSLDAVEDTRRHTALHLAALAGHGQVVRCLLNHGATILRNRDGHTALDYAQSLDEGTLGRPRGSGAEGSAKVLASALKRQRATCAECFAKPERSDGKGPLVCGRCRLVAYCSRGCQQAAWKEHKQRCATSGPLPARIEMGFNPRTGAVRMF